MRIAYYDESGDDGYPAQSSPIFALSALYSHYLNWKDSFETIKYFRGGLRDAIGLPVKMEFHTKYFLLNKNPYRSLGISDKDRVEVMTLFCDLIGSLDFRIVNVVIVKPRIKNPDYDVLQTSLKYSVQRIENDLGLAQDREARFMIITDPGRLPKMRRTTRLIQRFNYVPSKLGTAARPMPIRLLIEDPLPKESHESYFVQLADTVAFVVYLYGLLKTKAGRMSKRLPSQIDRKVILGWMEGLKPSLNLEAAEDDEYGVRFHPA